MILCCTNMSCKTLTGIATFRYTDSLTFVMYQDCSLTHKLLSFFQNCKPSWQTLASNMPLSPLPAKSQPSYAEYSIFHAHTCRLLTIEFQHHHLKFQNRSVEGVIACSSCIPASEVVTPRYNRSYKAHRSIHRAVCSKLTSMNAIFSRSAVTTCERLSNGSWSPGPHHSGETFKSRRNPAHGIALWPGSYWMTRSPMSVNFVIQATNLPATSLRNTSSPFHENFHCFSAQSVCDFWASD